MSYRRQVLDKVVRRLQEPRRFLQVLTGPRQVGKTTLVRQAMETLGGRCSYATADSPTPGDMVWLDQQWENARRMCAGGGSWLLVLDEIQKVPQWSESVKRLWDEDSARNLDLRIVILGSSPLLVQKGLSESLAGRFELIHISHWRWEEMRDAFGWNLDQYIYYGGYPGAAPLIEDEPRWRRYLLDSLIETTLSRDILLPSRVDKPALLRQVFRLGCEYTGQILSFQKMIGQLQDAGNTTTLAHYLDLLAGAGMVCGLGKYSAEEVRQRASSPKLQVLNQGLRSALAVSSLAATREDPELWGRITESAVGAYLANEAQAGELEVFYWREVSKEVDFVLRRGAKVLTIEVKSGRHRGSLPGVAAFNKVFGKTRSLLVGTGGIPIEEFLRIPPDGLF